MNCLIIDDNSKSATALEICLKSAGFIQVHRSVQTYLVRSLLSIEAIDYIFVRVRLWDFRVFEKVEQMPVVIFLSGGKDKLTDRPGVSVPFKLREPYQLSEVRQLVEKLKKGAFTGPVNFVFVRFDGRYHRIFLSDIEMIERMKMNFVKLWTKEYNLLLSGTMTSWIEKLPEGKFIRASDKLILPIGELEKIKADKYIFREREITLTFRFAAAARKELEDQRD